jgi:hypothetical protein
MWHRLTRADGEGKAACLGRPLPGVQIDLTDAAGKAVVDGAEGELIVGGPCVARGYWNLPELSAERFPDTPGGRRFRTGDLARRLPDGTFEFAGRLDHQIKIRGYRVDPHEVEHALRAAPGVRDVAVGVDDSTGHPRLIAYVVPGDDGADATALREYAHRALPEFMRPAGYVRLGRLPTNPSGKLDRRGLAPKLGEWLTASVPGGSAASGRVAEIWERLLGYPVPLDANFFESGGDSHLVLDLFEGLRREFGRPDRVVDLFRNPTIMDQARLVCGTPSMRNVGAIAGARAGRRRDALARRGADRPRGNRPEARR